MVVLAKGQEFNDVNHCHSVLKEDDVVENFKLQILKFDTSRFTIKCARKECNWRFHASKLRDAQIFII